MSHHHDAPHHGHDHELGHVIPYAIYRNVFWTLVVLTIVTVLVAAMEISKYSAALALVVAMAIASVKAFLVASYFMHLKFESKITWMYAFFPIMLLGLLLAGTFIDNPYRVSPINPDPAHKQITASEHATEHAEEHAVSHAGH